MTDFSVTIIVDSRFAGIYINSIRYKISHLLYYSQVI